MLYDTSFLLERVLVFLALVGLGWFGHDDVREGFVFQVLIDFLDIRMYT
jgi:hypothetical protein